MPSLKEVRNRIVSVGSTMQITSAMKMVSAAKLKRAQDAITQMRPYSNKMQEIIENVSSNLDATENKFNRPLSEKHILLIPVSSNRGLAGAFNANVIKKTWSIIRQESAGNKITIVPIGKKVQDAFRKTEYFIAGSDLPHHLNDLLNDLRYDNTAPVAERLMNAYLNKQFDRAIIIYNQFKNAAVQDVVIEQLLPVSPAAKKSEASGSRADYIFEPNKEFIINDLIPRSIKTQFHKALLDSMASEHGARMTAMHKATDNAKAMQRELKITYNKARQAAITKEILEIVGGAEALNG
ncbi:MAG: ATP synthase F1 subunit gamma [Bacteroidia bacterium]|jgi:F-type H+-transporting ATPase subunit gamma|nr:ATP synthase F1 subunit gamma [Bacteroidia bacterium]